MKSNIKRALALLIALLLALPTAAFADETAPEAAEAVLAVSNDAEALEEIPVTPDEDADEDPVFDHEPEVGEIEFTLGEDEDEPGADDFGTDESIEDDLGEDDFSPFDAPVDEEPSEPSPDEDPSEPSPSGEGVEERSDETDEVVTPSSTPDETDEESPSDAPSVPSPSGAAEGLAGRSGVEEHSDETDEVVNPSTSPNESDEVASPSSTPDETDEESPSDVTPSDSPSEDLLPAEDENLAEPIDETVEEALPFDQSMTVNGVEVRVSADPGVFPEDAVLSVKRVPSYKARLADAAIEDVRDADQNVAVAYTFDIKVLDAQRGELQPAGGERVEVSFALSEAGDANLAGSVYHITGEGGALTAQPLEVSADGDSVTAETDGFSLYTVEFTYNDIQYVMPGDTSVAMDEILSAVGLTGPVDAVRVSDETLFSASDATGAWIVTAHRPFSTHEWMILTINGVEIRVEVTDADTSTGNFAELQGLINNPGAGRTVTLEKDYIADTGDNPITIHTKVTIDLNGHTIDRRLTEATNTGFVINISEGGDVTVKDTPGNGIITGGYYTGSGGGICVDDGSLTLEGGTITGNHAVSGGGVAVYASTAEAKFIMNGGVIYDNTATFGGGVYVYAANNSNAKASFTMTGGKITGNLATATTTSTYGGGGVYIGNYNSSFTISGGEISDNETTGDYGGGVCCNGSSKSVFQMSGGKITGNKVIRDSESGHGGGIYLYNDRTFTMSGGEISGNEVKTNYTASGGGVSTSGIFNMTGGKILKNSVTGGYTSNSRGGGVYVNGYGKFTMSGSSTIGGSAATDANSAGKGGGVYVYGGTGGFTMNSGTISYNTTTGSYGGGGGVYVASDGKFTMNSGTISSNTATGSNSNGGGVYVDDGSFTMTNGLINLNKATNLGGGVHMTGDNPTFNLSGASKVTGNTRESTGEKSNVFLPSGKTLTIIGTLANDASIGVTTSATPSDESPVVITSGLSGKGNASRFTSDKQYGVELNSSNEAVLVNKKFNITVDNGLTNGTITANPSTSASGETITLTVTPKTGYELDGVPTVTPASGTVTVSGSGSTYTFTMPPSDVTVTASFKAIPYDLTGTAKVDGTGSVSFKVGDSAVTTATVGQTVRVVATPADGYQLTKLTFQPDGAAGATDILNERKFTMPAAGVEVVAEFKRIIHPIVSMSGYTYGSADMPEPAISGAPSGATVTCYYNTTESTTGGTEWKNMTSTSLPAGTYYIYAVVGETETTLDATTEATQFTVIPATITVTATDFSGTYDGDAHGISVTPSGLSSPTVRYGETSGTYDLEANPTYTDVGSYTVYYQVTADNYQTVTGSEKVEISSADLTDVRVEQKGEPTYAGQPQTATVTAEATAVNDQTVTFTYCAVENGTYTTSVPAFTNAGTHTVYYKASAPNHSEASGSFTVTIAQRPITLTADSGSKAYDGTALTKDSYTLTSGALATGDNITSVTVTGTRTNAGESANVPSEAKIVNGTGGDVTANYAITYANGTLTVNRKAVTLTAKSAERAYNGSALTEGRFESSGLEAGDSHAFAVAMTAESTITDFGTQPNVIATVDGVAVATGQETIVGNYLVTTAAGTLTITKAANAVTTVPTAAAGLVYSAEDQKLIADAGAARGGTMQYAVTTGGAPSDGDWQDGIDAITGRDATDYTVWYRVAGGANYEDVEARSFPVSIAPKPVGLSWGDTSFIYDGDSHAPEATATGVVQGDAVSVSVGGAKTDANAAGEHYTATATGLSGAKAGNYALSDAATQNFTIAPLTVTLSWGGTSFTYDGQPHVPDAAVGNKVGGDDVSVTVGGAKTAAGEHYTATATGLTGAKAGNYALPAEVTKDFTIAPLTVSLSWGGTSFTYDGQPHVPEAAVGNKVGADEITVTVDGAKTDANAAGEHYTATATALDNDNYKLPDAATVDFTIAPLTVTLSWGETSFTYDGQPHAPEAAVGNKVGNDEISVTVDGAKTDAGENYTAEAAGLTGAKAGNYALPAEVTREFTIAKAAARAIPDVTREVIYTQIANPIEVSLAGKMPDDAGTLEYSKGEPKHTGEIQFREAALDPDGQLTLRFDEGGEPGDSFSMTITIRSANYADSTVKVAVTLTDKTDAGVSIAQGERVTATYGDGAIALEGVVEDPGHGEGMLTWTSSDEAVATVDEDGVVTIVGAGEATVTASYASDTTKGEAKLVLTVQPKAIDAARVALDVARLTYNGANQSAAVTGVTLDGEPLDAACYAISGALTGRNAGTYTVTVTGAGNYGGAARAQWTIAPKALAVTARPARKSAGDADPALTWTADGLVGGDALTGALTRDAGEAAGVYAIRLGSLSAGDNYALSFTGSQLTIEPRPARADYTLLAAMRTAGSTAFNLTWTDAANAEGYDVFFAACSQNGAYRVIHSAPADAPHQFTVTGVRRTGCYKAYVRAWRMIDGARTYIGDPSPTVHAIAGGYSTKACNARAILLRRARLSLGVGSRKAIGATLEGVRSDRVVLSHARLLRYFSSDANVATVSAAGVVTAVGEGSCQITVMANNGILKTVAVTVHASPTRMRFKKKRYSVKRNRRLNLVKKLSLAPAGLEGALTWESSDPAVVRVSAKGVIRGLKKGIAIITVTAADGRTARTKIRVK